MTQPKLRAVRASILASVSLVALLALSPMLARAQTPNAPAAAAAALQALPDFSELAAAVSPAVVQVAVTATEIDEEAGVPPQFRGTPLAPLFGQGSRQAHRVRGLGSGFVIDPSGYIVTNYHVAGRADDIQIVFADGTRLPAKRIGADARTDIALLKVDSPKPLAAVALGDSDAVRIGQWVLAVGNPFGLGGTVTAGIVSARARDIGAGPYDDFLQIDAAINQGNSGGPSFGRDGKVIGMNTAIFSPNGGSVGLGFAIPSNLVRKVVDQLRVHGSVDRAWLGVQTQSIDETLAAALKLPSAQGALIGSVQKNSPADQAGLRRGDVILALDSSAIGDPRDLSRRVGDLASGTKATFDIWRDGRRIATTVALGAAPADAAPVAVAAPEPQTPVAGLGLRLARGGQGETVVAEIAQDGLAEQAGLRPGDVLLEADRQRIRGPNDLAAALRTARQTQRPGIALFLSRDGQPLYLALPVPALRG